jgi:hypothetical protein
MFFTSNTESRGKAVICSPIRNNKLYSGAGFFVGWSFYA